MVPFPRIVFTAQICIPVVQKGFHCGSKFLLPFGRTAVESENGNCRVVLPQELQPVDTYERFLVTPKEDRQFRYITTALTVRHQRIPSSTPGLKCAASRKSLI
jgi:hypothetical protein